MSRITDIKNKLSIGKALRVAPKQTEEAALSQTSRANAENDKDLCAELGVTIGDATRNVASVTDLGRQTEVKPSVSVFTLGCKTNLYESQQIGASLTKSGYKVNFGLIWADIFVINTCAVTQEAESKSRQAVARAQKIYPNAKIIMVGCAVDRNAEQFLLRNGVCAVVGNSNKNAVVDVINGLWQNQTKDNSGLSEKSAMANNGLNDNQTSVSNTENGNCVQKFVGEFSPTYQQTVFATPSHTRALIKIQDGCNNFCSYCIVPYLRGRSRSRQIDSIVEEVRSNQNAKEFVLLGIDISQYGRDIGVSLADLLNALSFTSARIRIGSIYQDCINEQLLISMQRCCKHFHLSLQSGCDKTLKDMNRHYTTEQFASAVRLIRSFYPDAAITTDVIVGFCGETEQDFEQTCRFIEEIAFADIHIFPYSPRKGTVAYGRAVPTNVKPRIERLTEIKKRLHKTFLSKFLGATAEILTEERKGNYTEGYTDNYIKVYVEQSLPINSLQKVILTQIFKDGMLAVPQE